MRTREIASREQWLSTVTERMIHAEAEVEQLREDLEYVAEALENGHSGIEIAKQVRARLRAALTGESGI